MSLYVVAFFASPSRVGRERDYRKSFLNGPNGSRAANRRHADTASLDLFTLHPESDRIIVLEQGRIVAQGRHADLLQSFAALV